MFFQTPPKYTFLENEILPEDQHQISQILINRTVSTHSILPYRDEGLKLLHLRKSVFSVFPFSFVTADLQ
jgi:hypothetical protein